MKSKKKIKRREQKRERITVLIDESGTLPDPNSPVVIVAAVGTKFVNKLVKITSLVRKSASSKKATKSRSEIKFYTSGEKTKRKFLEILKGLEIRLYVLVIDKGRQEIPDSPENYALICWLLIRDCLSLSSGGIDTVIFDKHFHRRSDQEKFDVFLLSLLDKKIDLRHLDSQSNPEINAADMVAGSVLWVETGKDKQFYLLIRNRIVLEKKLHWKEIKREFLAIKKLARTGAGTHPEQD